MEITPKILSKRNKALIQIQKQHEIKKNQRQDTKKNMKHVVISEKRVKEQSKYKIDIIPYPFTTREEYERSLQMPLGGKRILCL